MRRTGGFRTSIELEAFGQRLVEEGFYVEIKPFGVLKYLDVKSDNLHVELYLREAYTPDEGKELTPKDENLFQIVKTKYPYEGMPKFQLSC